MAKNNTTRRTKASKAMRAPAPKKVATRKPAPAKRAVVLRKTSPAPQTAPVAIITDIRETVVTPSVIVLAPAVTYEQIAIRAYQIYRARMDAKPEDDWLQAERELKAL